MERQEGGQIELPKGARPQQVDPDTGELYPWWVPDDDGNIHFKPSLYQSSLYKPCGGETFKLPTNPNLELENPFDLNNLRIIDPEMVVKAFQDFIRDAEKYPKRLGTILIGTGGTLSMIADNKGELHPKLTPEFLMKQAGDIKNKFFASSVSTPTLIDSSQMKSDYISDVVIVMSYLYERLLQWKDEGGIENYEHRDQILSRFSGFIVCHGTDSLVQSQTYLSFMLGSFCPFNAFYVGAQKTVEDRGNDVGANFKLALEACEYFHGQLPGICATCAGGTGGGVYNGATSFKENDKYVNFLSDCATGGKILENFDGSQNLEFMEGLRKQKSEYIPYLYKTEAPNFPIPPILLRGYGDVAVINPSLGKGKNNTDPNEVGRQLRDSKSKAVILETYPSFTLDRQVVDEVVKVANEPGKKRLVFAVNGSPGGSTNHAYADSHYIMKQGIVPLQMLTHAACAKLDLALAMFGDDIHKIISFMVSNNFRNEQLHISKKTTEKRGAYKPEALTRSEQLEVNLVNKIKSQRGEDVSSFMLDTDRYRYLDIHSVKELHMINDPAVKKVVDNNRVVLRRVLGDVLGHITQEPNFKAWAKKSRKTFTDQVLRNSVNDFLESSRRVKYFVNTEIIPEGEGFVDRCRIDIAYLTTKLLEEMGFKRKLRRGKKNNPRMLFSTEPYQSLVGGAASLIRRRPDIYLQDADAMMPHLGQPVKLLRGETWKNVERAVERIRKDIAAEEEATKKQPLRIVNPVDTDPDSEKPHLVH